MTHPAESSSRETHQRARRLLPGAETRSLLLRGGSGSGMMQALGAVLALTVQLALARALGVSHFGHYALALAWITVLSQFCRLGFRNSLIRFTAQYRAHSNRSELKGLLIRAPQLSACAAVITAGILGTVVITMVHSLEESAQATLLVAALLLAPLTLLGITQGFLQGAFHPVKALAFTHVVPHACTLGLVLTAITITGLENSTSAMGLTVAAHVVAIVLAAYWLLRILAPEIGGARPTYRTRYWIRASLPLLIMTSMQMLMKQTDTIMLGTLIGSESAGLYFPAARASDLANIGLLSINAVAAPMIADLHAKGERRRLQHLLTLVATGASILTLLTILACWLFGEWGLSLFGPEFVAAYPALLLLLVGQAVNAVCGPVGYVMTMTGEQDRAAVVLVVIAVINIALNLALIPPFGLEGAAAATAISTILWNLAMLFQILRRHRLNPTILSRWVIRDN